VTALSNSARVLAFIVGVLVAVFLAASCVVLAVSLLQTPTEQGTPTRFSGAEATSASTITPTQALVVPTRTSLPPTVEPTESPTATPSPSSSPIPTEQSALPVQPRSKYGMHLLLDDDRNHWTQEVWPQHVRAARQIAGEGGYVVQLIRIDDLDVERWQFFLDLCAQEKLIPIIRLASTFDHVNKWWEAPPKDSDGQGFEEISETVQEFFAQLRWPAGQRYVIVHNEPNRGDEWSNQPNPAEYARFLTDMAAALHPVGITILGPALDLYAPHSNGQLINGHRYIDAETFLDEMAAAQPEALEAIDVWASHAYPLDPFRADPSRQVFQIDYAHGASNPRHQPPPAGIYNRGINSYRWELWKLEQIIGVKARSIPVFITESGYRHAPTQDSEARDHVHAEISFETMSTWLDLAFHGNNGRYPDQPQEGWTPWNDDPRVQVVVMFALGGYPPDWGHTNWVVLDQKGRITAHYPITLRK
jgi:hypothetical protein